MNTSPAPVVSKVGRVMWRKAKASAANGACVEAAVLDTDTAAFSDSKLSGDDKPVFGLNKAEFLGFLAAVKKGHLDPQR